MDMPFVKIPKRMVIEIVKSVTILINSIPRCGGVHDAMSARELVTGKTLKVPRCKIGEFVYGHLPTNNDTGKSRTVDALYLQPNDNGSGHWVFKLKTKEAILVVRVTPSPMSESIIDLVNSMGTEEGEVKGVEFRDMFGKVTINTSNLQQQETVH